MHSSNGSVHSDIETLGDGLGEGIVAVPHAEVGTGELKVVVLVPVLEGQGSEDAGIGKLQVGKVPIEDLPVSRGEVYAGEVHVVEIVQFVLQILSLFHQSIVGLE